MKRLDLNGLSDPNSQSPIVKGFGIDKKDDHFRPQNISELPRYENHGNCTRPIFTENAPKHVRQKRGHMAQESLKIRENKQKVRHTNQKTLCEPSLSCRFSNSVRGGTSSLPSSPSIKVFGRCLPREVGWGWLPYFQMTSRSRDSILPYGKVHLNAHQHGSNLKVAALCKLQQNLSAEGFK